MSGSYRRRARQGRRRVGVNLLWLVPEAVGGSEQSTVGYLAELAKQAPDDLDVTVFALPAFLAAHPELTSSLPTEVAPVSGRRKGLRVATETTWLAAQAVRHRLDLVHHAGGVVPLVHPVPSVVTIHDLQPLSIPENFAPVKRRYLATMLPRTARAARLVLTPTEDVRQAVVARLGVEPARVVVTPYGIEPRRHPLPSPARRAALRAAYRLPGPFFVLPAITYPHKNHAVLVAAFSAVLAEHPDATLVFAGGAGPSEADLAEAVERAGIGRAVRRVGRVAPAEIDALLAEATALTFPSRYEGFGLPVLEAMNAGTAVLAADTTALPEVVGDAGLLLDPDDPAAWAQAMRRMIAEPARRAELIERGRARVAAMTWQAGTVATLAAYRRVLGAPGAGEDLS